MRQLRAASSSRTWVWIVGRTGRTEAEPNHLVPLMMRRGRRFPALVLVSLPCPARLELSPVELDLITATPPAVALGQDLALSFSSFSLPANWAKSLKHPHGEENPEQHLLV